MVPGVLQHVDRKYDIYEIPDELRGGLLYQPLHRMRAGTSIDISLNAACSVYLCFHFEEDGGYSDILQSLPGWTEIDGVVKYDSFDAAHHGIMTIYQFDAAAGSSVSIPATVERDACFNLVFRFADKRDVSPFAAGLPHVESGTPPISTAVSVAAPSSGVIKPSTTTERLGKHGAEAQGMLELSCERELERLHRVDGLETETLPSCGRQLLYQLFGVAYILPSEFVVDLFSPAQIMVQCCGASCPAISSNISLYARLVGPQILALHGEPAPMGSIALNLELQEPGEYHLEVSLGWVNGRMYAPNMPTVWLPGRSQDDGAQKFLGSQTRFANQGFADERCQHLAQVRGSPMPLIAVGSRKLEPRWLRRERMSCSKLTREARSISADIWWCLDECERDEECAEAFTERTTGSDARCMLVRSARCAQTERSSRWDQWLHARRPAGREGGEEADLIEPERPVCSGRACAMWINNDKSTVCHTLQSCRKLCAGRLLLACFE